MGAKRVWLAFQATLSPCCYGHHYLSPLTRVGEPGRPLVGISIKIEALPHTATMIQNPVLWGKGVEDL